MLPTANERTHALWISKRNKVLLSTYRWQGDLRSHWSRNSRGHVNERKFEWILRRAKFRWFPKGTIDSLQTVLMSRYHVRPWEFQTVWPYDIPLWLRNLWTEFPYDCVTQRIPWRLCENSPMIVSLSTPLLTRPWWSVNQWLKCFHSRIYCFITEKHIGTRRWFT